MYAPAHEAEHDDQVGSEQSIADASDPAAGDVDDVGGVRLRPIASGMLILKHGTIPAEESRRQELTARHIEIREERDRDGIGIT